ncbi:NitT/TauT family transport system substrate-binding protein OS=Castellaniella defragrans OX=75697 GN=HNR28_002969 PE=4 SV=1 [Castellaniella defragrans]
MKKLLSVLSLSLALGVAVAPMASQAATPEKTDVSIAVGGRVALYYLPLNIADYKGYFKEEGLNVRVIDFKGGTDAVRAVAGGSADVLSSAFEHIITLQSKGQNLEGFVLQGRYPGFTLTLREPLASTYRSPKDLKGLKIGVTAPGSSTNIFLDLLLKKVGMTSSSVAVVGIGADAGAVAAMQQGMVDGAVEADPATSLIVENGKAKVVTDTRNEKGTVEVYGGPMPAASLSAPVAFIKKNPHTIQALTNAMVKALHFLQTASDQEILDTLPPKTRLGSDQINYLKVIAAVRPSFSPDGLISKQAAQTALHTLALNDPGIESKVDLSKTYTNRFVKQASGKAH